ncbi:MAG: phosphotransferase [Actinomycetota bacterium]
MYQVLRDDRVIAYLKVAAGLREERDRLEWLDGRLPVPKVLSHGSCEQTEWLLTTPLPGLDLTNLKHTEHPNRITTLLADALRTIHATPSKGFPFGKPSSGAVLTHGDACLPNFLFLDGELTGVVDLGDCGLKDRALDLATAVWSVQYNLGAGHAQAFLDSYGIDLEAESLQLALNEDGIEALRRVDESGTV